MNESVFRLIEQIYSSVEDPARWAVFLEAYVRAVRGKCAAIVIFTSAHEVEPCIACWHNLPQEDIRLYASHYAADDPFRRAGPRIAREAVVPSHDICTEDELRNSVAYREFYGPRDLFFGLGVTFLDIEGKMSALTMLRSYATGPCGEEELEITRLLVPHLQRAALLYGELTATKGKLQALTAHMDRYPQGFALADGEGRVIHVNEAGRQLIGRCDGLTIRGNRLVLMSATKNKELQAGLRQVAGDRKSAVRCIEVSRPGGKPFYRILLMPLVDAGVFRFGIAQPTVAILMIDVEAGARVDVAMLKDLFSLTNGEARVAGLLVEGKSIEEVAVALGISRETVRTHTRRILSKTETSRQGELISLVLRAIPFG